MSLVIEDRTCFSGFCPCLYYNAVLGHVKQDWLCQPCLACILLITFGILPRYFHNSYKKMVNRTESTIFFSLSSVINNLSRHICKFSGR